MNLVLFDFDSTVTTLDTTLPFGVFVAERCSARPRLFLLVSALLLAKVRLVSNSRLKGIFARLLLRGQTMDRIQQLALEFHDTHLNALTDDGALSALRTHVDNGDCVYLVSANFDFFLQPLVARWSLAGVIATRTEYRAGVCTGRIVGAACHGHEKLRRAITHFGATNLGKSVAYGNQDDSPLLNAVRTGCLVRRTKPRFPLGLLRRYYHILSGQISRIELTTALRIGPFPAARNPKASMTV
jgi:phosphatidylglycerophosphatase C